MIKRPSLLIGLVVLTLAVAGGVLGGPSLWRVARRLRHAQSAAAREPNAVAAWRKAYGDPWELIGTFARPRNNTTADQLAALSRPLGIALVSPSSGSLELPEANAIGRYTGPTSDMTAPPASVRSYLEAHSSDIGSIVDLLTTADAPVWKSAVVAPLPMPIPDASIIGIRLLNNVLAAEALFDASAGRPNDADRAMRAAWRVLGSLRIAPEVVSQLISLNLAAADSAILRRIASDETAWHGRLGEYDYPTAMARAIEMNVAERILLNQGSWLQRGFLADYLDGMRAEMPRLLAMRLVDPVPAMPSFTSADEHSIAPGTIVAELAGPGLERSYREALCTELDFELTDRVLAARQERLRRGRWPETIPDTPSGIVAGTRWVYGARADDTISISLNRSLPSCPATFQSFVARQ